MNPGGPGASGLDLVDYVSSQVPKAITDRFDIVAWDPRGSGKSNPVDCGTDLDARFAPDSSPDDAAELAALEQAAKNLVDACVRRSGDLLAHISTGDTVQDLDVLRAALGDDRLTYLGFSYGTFIGALYAQRYPDHVRALVLDGALDPALPVEDVAIQQAQGFDASLARFVDWCHARASCAFHGGGDVRGAYDALVRKADATPTGGSNRFGPTQFDIAVAAVLYGGESDFGLLASSLRADERGDPSRLLSIYDSYVGRTGNTYDSEWPAFIAISCADGPNLSVAETEALQRRAEAAAPDFGAANIGLGFECAYWPDRPMRTAVGSRPHRHGGPRARGGHAGRSGDALHLGGVAHDPARDGAPRRRRRLDAHREPERQRLPRRDPRPLSRGPGPAGIGDGLRSHRLTQGG